MKSLWDFLPGRSYHVDGRARIVDPIITVFIRCGYLWLALKADKITFFQSRWSN